jgi:hypothetical protein
MREPARRPDRWWVLLRGLLAGAALTALATAHVAVTSPGYISAAGGTALHLLGPACGPFAIAFVTPDYSRAPVLGLGLTLAALIALHPVRPHWVTAGVSGLALIAWFLLGVTLTYTRF